ncbi:MAG TPA: alkaline phosphatase family protein [Longimicrobium sp.]|nr:alkaline phosphatase family protein [Longimicrobium sp.]
MIRRAAAAVVAAVLAAAPALAQQPAAAPAEPPKLVVFITVDQLRPDYFTRWGSQMTGGLKRLWEGGAVFTDAHQDHAITETAPGHASTLSGRFPRSTGIIRNVEGVQDPQSPVLGNPRAEKASPFRFRGSTLTDWMRLKDPATRALSVSRKDRGAIFPMGRGKQSVFWYAYDGRFSTSTYYADTLPDWVERFNARDAWRRHLGQSWTLLLPASAYPEPDSVIAEAAGRNVTFPHVFPTDSAAAVAELPQMPWMDQLTLDFALEGLNAMALGAGPATDVLAVSLSTTDAVGHRYGPDSREIHDQVLRLDRMLGVFLDSLYALHDSSRVVIALTADHGVASIPEIRPGGPEAAAMHVDPTLFRAWLNGALLGMGRQLGMAIDTLAVQGDDGLFYYNRDAFAAIGRDPAELARLFADYARTVPGVLRVDLPADLPRADTMNDAVARRWLHMLPPDLPAFALVTLRPGNVWGRATYAQHGAPHDYDTRVPVIFYGPHFRPGKHGRFARVVDIAPTLAHVLRVQPTEPLDGRVLTEAIR